MESGGSVTRLIDRAKAGDNDAVRQLWDRYFQQLLGIGGRRLDKRTRRVSDEDDVAVSAFDSLFRGMKEGKFPKLNDRGDLWALLLVIADRKAGDYRKREKRLKRGGGKVSGESAMDARLDGKRGIEQVLNEEPTPEMLVIMEEEFDRLIDLLRDEVLQTVARLKFEGYTNEEIADRLKCARPTIERKLRRIRSIWTHDDKSEDE